MKSKKVPPVIKENKDSNEKMPSAVFLESAKDFCEEYGIDKVILALRNA